MADRLTASIGQSSTSPSQRRQASLPVEMPSSATANTDLVANDDTSIPPTSSSNSSGGRFSGMASTGSADVTTSAATELLLKRIQELVERAQQADEQLQIEKRFSELYKTACSEKEDQLAERVSSV